MNFNELSCFEIERKLYRGQPVMKINGRNGAIYFTSTCIRKMGKESGSQIKVAIRKSDKDNCVYMLIDPNGKEEGVYTINHNQFQSRLLVRAIEKHLALNVQGKFIHTFDIHSLGDDLFRFKYKNSMPSVKGANRAKRKNILTVA